MKAMLLTRFLTFAILVAGSSSLDYLSQQQKLFVYQERVRITQRQLFSRCPEAFQFKRELITDTKNTDISFRISIEKELYESLLRKLVECDSNGSGTSTILPISASSVQTTKNLRQPVTNQPSTSQPVTRPLPTSQPYTSQSITSSPSTIYQPPSNQSSTNQPSTSQPSTIQPSTSPPSTNLTTISLATNPPTKSKSTVSLADKSTFNASSSLQGSTTPAGLIFSTTPDYQANGTIPNECLTATNLSDSWRSDYNGSDIRPYSLHSSTLGYTCDLHQDLQWFRFSGAAGRKMLNECPPVYSCGAYIPFWTDVDPPRAVGVPITAKFYESYAPQLSCKGFTRQMQVMRCSLQADDLIYKYSGEYFDSCSAAFCGMM